MRKKLIVMLALLTVALLTSCAQPSEPISEMGETESGGAETSEKERIVTTTFHEYDWVNQILGDNVENFELTMLIDNGVDLHSFEPNVQDIATVTSSDLFIYNGGESAGWIEELLAKPENSHINGVEVMELLADAVKAEVQVEGMQQSEHAHDEEEAHVHDE